MNAKVTPPLTWHICIIIVDSLGPIVSTCSLNHYKGHWLLNDALNYAIFISLKFRDEIDFVTFDSLMEDGIVVYELSCLASNIKKKVLDYFISFFKKYEEKKSHNIFFKMLNPRFKTLCLVSTLIAHEQGKAIVEEYDKKSMSPMFLKYFYHLHPLVESEKDVVEQRVEEDRSLDIFGMIANISDPTIELVNIKLVIFKCYQVDVKNI
jgi:hypothetical protein